MKAIVKLALFLWAVASVSYAEEKWPLVINADPTWQIDYQGDGIHFFNLTRPEGENVAFTLHAWSGPGGKEQIPLFIKRVADSIAQDSLTNLIPFVAKEDYEIEKIAGTEFSGQAAIFEH